MSKVLIVEDNDTNRKVASALLEFEKHEVVMTSDGFKAVALAKTEKPDLILMDIQLIEICGIDIIKEMKADTALKDIPIVAVTALAMKGDRERILSESGCDDYLSKPFFRKDFMAMVNRHLGVEV